MSFDDNISASSKYIDGRAVEDRIEELESEVDDFERVATEAGWTFHQDGSEWVATGPDNDDSPGNEYRDESRDIVVVCAAEDAGARWTSLTDVEELDDLRALRDESRGYGGWPNCTLVNEDRWIEYVQEVADGLGGVNDEWPHRHIDWDAAAEELREDFIEVLFGSTSFLMRT